eukprot:UN05163
MVDYWTSAEYHRRYIETVEKSANSFQTIKEDIQSGVYTTIDEIEQEIRSLFRDRKRTVIPGVIKPDHAWNIDTETIENLFNDLIQQLYDDLELNDWIT